ncbi:MAG: hypothetical protein IJ736_14665 [Firmicutes bacterium]|nr:hypothetical protein [Bacillota bacterium]
MSTNTKSTLVYKVIILPKNSANSAVSMTSANAPSGDKYAVDSTYSYIIHTVTAAEMGYNELALANSSDEVVKSTDTVYSTITFPDGSSITAPEGTYLYAVKVNKTTAPTAVNYKWINNNQ